MPQITVNRKVFETLVGKKLPLDKLKDRISMLGTDLDEVTDTEIKVEIFPDRPDMLSEQGFARAFSAFIGVKKGLRHYTVKDSGMQVIIDKSLKNIRPYTACAIVRNMKFDDEKIREVIQIQEKLHVSYGRNRKRVAIGIYPLEKITPPIYFTAKDPSKVKFRPLEYPDEITGLQILSKHPTGREYAHLLDGAKKFPFFIDAAGKILSMPPIINSHDVGKITEQTTDVFIECSGFDYDVLAKCLNFIVTAFADMGGEIYSMELVYDDKKIISPNLQPFEMPLDLGYVNKILGLQLNEAEVKDCLERMGFSYDNGKVLVPAWRADILHMIDLVEDIAIAYGYENFDEIIPNVATIGQIDKFNDFTEKILNVLVGAGLIETNTYCIINKDEQTKLMNLDYSVIELQSSVSEEYNSLRFWMIPSLLKVLRDNRQHEYPQCIYEAGRVFMKDTKNVTETGVSEAVRLAVALCAHDADYTKIRQILDIIFEALALSYEVKETEHPSFIAGRVARVYVKDKAVAYIGELHPKVLSNYELLNPVAALELNLTDLFEVYNS